MKRREFLHRSAAGAALLLGPAGCLVPAESGGRAEPTGQPDRLVLRDDGALASVGQDVELEVFRAEHVVRILRSAGTVTVGGLGSGRTDLNSPTVALQAPGAAGDIFVVDRGNGRVQVYSPQGAHVASLAQGELNMPGGAAFSKDGTLHVADTLNHRVVSLDGRGRVVATLEGSGDARLNGPAAVTLDLDGNLHILESGGGRVVVMDARGSVVRAYSGARGRFRAATAITTGPDGAIYVADASDAAVLAFHPNGTPLATHRPRLAAARLSPLGLAFSGGDLWVSGQPGAPV